MGISWSTSVMDVEKSKAPQAPPTLAWPRNSVVLVGLTPEVILAPPRILTPLLSARPRSVRIAWRAVSKRSAWTLAGAIMASRPVTAYTMKPRLCIPPPRGYRAFHMPNNTPPASRGAPARSLPRSLAVPKAPPDTRPHRQGRAPYQSHLGSSRSGGSPRGGPADAARSLPPPRRGLPQRPDPPSPGVDHAGASSTTPPVSTVRLGARSLPVRRA